MKILLVCSGGMSTSLLAEAMKKEAAVRGLSCAIEAVSLSALPGLAAESCCILAAPQVRHRFQSVQETAKRWGKPAAVLDAAAYGRIDGKAALEQALNLMQAP